MDIKPEFVWLYDQWLAEVGQMFPNMSKDWREAYLRRAAYVKDFGTYKGAPELPDA